jgi:hypothetical protein
MQPANHVGHDLSYFGQNPYQLGHTSGQQVDAHPIEK